MSLLSVPSTPFPPIFSSPTTTPTPLTGLRLTPCATPLWGGPPGHLADPTPNIGSEPKFCIDVSSEHTPINLPTRSMGFQQEYDATIAASEDLNLPRHSGASSSSQHTAASTVPTLLKLGSLGTGLRKLSADFDSVACRTSIRETCADTDRETVVSSLFGSVSKGKRDRDQHDCLKVWTKKQQVVSLSTAESELHAAVKTASEGLGIQSAAKDLGISCAQNLHLDASATMCLVNRRGLGKAMHIDMQNLWIQEASKSGQFEVGTSVSPGDLLTKPLPKQKTEQLMNLMGYEFMKTGADVLKGRREHDGVFGPKVVKMDGESVTPLLVVTLQRAICMAHIKVKVMSILGQCCKRCAGHQWPSAYQGVAGVRLGAPSQIDDVVFGSGAEVPVGRMVNAVGVSFCKLLKCLMVVSHVPEGKHCARPLRHPDIPSGHTVVSSFGCAVSDLRLICVTASMAQVKQLSEYHPSWQRSVRN